MNVSQKCHHALRAMLELAMRHDRGVTSIAEIVASQRVPARFLESILVELKRGGLVESRRGVRGGYVLAMNARDISVGHIIRLIDGEIVPLAGVSVPLDATARGRTALGDLWQRAAEALAEIYDTTMLHDLVEQERSMLARSTPMYSI
ncbi:MAG: Rrf2 family transcriptional regulator [Planctomycetaceae bacterium]|nr:Rrf2 family transcriptional regulator [Planctomycetaceae bacterium]